MGRNHTAIPRVVPRTVAALLALLLWLPCARAQAPLPGLTEGPTLTATTIAYAASFDLSDGSRVRLVGIRAPKPDAPPFSGRGEALGAEAKAFVEGWVRGRTLTLFSDANPQDRYGRRLAHVVRDDGLWLQRALLENGFAQVYTLPDNRRGAAELLAAENAARRAGRGLWALPESRVRTAAEVEPGGFRIVEGVVLTQSSGDGPTYLNFGRTWKSDFTVRIAPADRKRFGARMPDYRGKRLRVRGWVFEKDGPMLDATHPEQIEVLE